MRVGMEKTLVGVILRPQGIKGEIKVEPFTDNPKRFLDLKSIYIEGGENPVKILHCRENSGNVFLLTDAAADRTTAEKLRGKKLFINKSERKKLPEGHYYIQDIIGAEVEGVGTLVEVLQYGAADVFRVKTEKGFCMFPSIKSVVLSVDSKKIIVDKAELEKVIIYE